MLSLKWICSIHIVSAHSTMRALFLIFESSTLLKSFGKGVMNSRCFNRVLNWSHRYGVTLLRECCVLITALLSDDIKLLRSHSIVLIFSLAHDWCCLLLEHWTFYHWQIWVSDWAWRRFILLLLINPFWKLLRLFCLQRLEVLLRKRIIDSM